MGLRKRWFLLLVMALTIAVTPGAYAAQPSPAEQRAQPIVDQGLEDMRRSRYREALDAFKRANEIWPTPSVVARMGLAAQGLGDWIDAERHLQSALKVSADKFIHRNREVLERALNDVQSHLGKITVEGSPEGAVVRIDGISRGLFPKAGPVSVVAGTRTVEVSAPGHVDARQMLDVPARKQIDLRVDLVPNPGVPPAAVSGGVATGSDVSFPEPAAQEPTAAPRSAGQGWTLRHTAWVSLGVGTALAAGGWLLFQNANDDLPPLETAEYLPLAASGLGAAMALGGLSYLVLETWFVPVAGPEQIGLAATGRF